MSLLRLEIRTDVPHDQIYVVEIFVKSYDDYYEFDCTEHIHIIDSNRILNRLLTLKDFDEGKYQVIVKLLNRHGAPLALNWTELTMRDDDQLTGIFVPDRE